MLSLLFDRTAQLLLPTASEHHPNTTCAHDKNPPPACAVPGAGQRAATRRWLRHARCTAPCGAWMAAPSMPWLPSCWICGVVCMEWVAFWTRFKLVWQHCAAAAAAAALNLNLRSTTSRGYETSQLHLMNIKRVIAAFRPA